MASFVFGICRMVVLDLRRGDRRDATVARDLRRGAYRRRRLPQPNFDQARSRNVWNGLSERERTVLLLTFYDDMPADGWRASWI